MISVGKINYCVHKDLLCILFYIYFLLFWSHFHFSEGNMWLVFYFFFFVYSKLQKAFSALLGNYKKQRCGYTGKYYTILLFSCILRLPLFLSLLVCFFSYLILFFSISSFFVMLWFSIPLLLFVSYALLLISLALKNLSPLFLLL